MPDPFVALDDWPGPLTGSAPIVVRRIATPPGDRRAARLLARQALREALAEMLDRPAGEIELTSTPGSGIRLVGTPGIGLSVSHEEGLSLMAIHFNGAIGIDLLSHRQVAASQKDLADLARDYLGSNETAESPEAFAAAWCAHEAALKCLGLPLQEWTPALGTELARCHITPLALPAGWCGAIATLQKR